MCFQYDEMGHYTRQSPLNKGKGVRQIVIGTVSGVEDMTSQFEIVFSMNYCLSYNIVFSVGWYVDSGALRHITCDMSPFNMIQE
jgi:hypothetical protein